MKLMICANLGVGSLPAIDLPSSKIAQWQEDRVRALSLAMEDAKSRGAEACIIAGGLFAQDFVAQSLLESTIRAAGGSGLPARYVPLPGELADVGGRMPQVGGASVDNVGEDGGLTIRLGNPPTAIPVVTGMGLEAIEDVARPHAVVAIIRSGNDVGVSLNDGSGLVTLGPLASSAFGDRTGSGYLLVEATDTEARAEWIECAVHPFVVREVAIDRPQSTRELVITVGEAVKGVDRAACLRVELKGRMPLDVYINTEELAEQLGRYFFYVEVVDECELDLDIAELDTDVSLLAEFVRRVTGDDSLSEAEKTRILRCGWNVLNGKELAE